MAILNESQNGKALKGRSKKPTPKVDLTAMVDLMFLLTTFFMLTTTLSKLNAADIAKPVRSDIRSNYPASRTLTLVLGQGNLVYYYMGETANAKPRQTLIANLQSVLISYKTDVGRLYLNDPGKNMIVILKPSAESKFQNFVDAIDELKIADIKAYAIDDEGITDQEKKIMKTKSL